MMHRRTQASGSGIPPIPPPISTIPEPEKAKNKAYTPLRRQSTNLYGTPSSTGKARYNIPTPSPQYVGLTSPPLFPGGSNGPYDAQRGGTGFGYGGGDFGSADVGEERGKGGEGIMGALRDGIENMRRGLRDAIRLERSWGLVWGDRELRTLVIKSTLINLLSLLLLSLAPLILSPLFLARSTSSSSLSPHMESRTKEIGMWYNLLLSWPVFIVCFWVNASWAPDISKRAQTLLHPTYRHQPSPASTPTSAQPTLPTPSSSSSSTYLSLAKTTITRILLISDFTLVTRLIHFVPLIGRPLATAYMSMIDAYYFFEYTFVSKQWRLEYRTIYVQERVAYMIGFGFPATIATSFGPPLVTMALFALLYPFFVIQALQSRPPIPRSSTSSLSSNTLFATSPSPYQSRAPSPGLDRYSLDGGSRDPFFQPSSTSIASDPVDWMKNVQPRVPIFFFARYALEGLRWLEEALLRDRGGGASDRRRSYAGKERPGKRLM